MPNFTSSTEWYEQSSMLLKARPSTARVTSKYTVLKPTSSKVHKREKYASKRAQTTSASSTTAADAEFPLQDAEAPSATFSVKTYDPVSGTCLQYETNKQAEVGRLIATLGRLGKHMAAIPEVTNDPSAPTTGNAGIETQVGTPAVEKDEQMGGLGGKPPAAGGAGGAGGKNKKKKGGKK